MDQLTLKIVKTRKPHKCWGCGKEYPAGTRMKYSVTVDQGDFNSSYWCDSCEEILSKLKSLEYEDGLAFGELKEYVEETG